MSSYVQGPSSHDDDYESRQTGLQGLLRRFGAGLEDVFPIAGASSGGGRVKSIIRKLRDDDEDSQISGLTELCEYISISSEDILISFPTDQVVPLLVEFLGAEHNPDVMLLAARALTFLADIFPPACSSIIRHGAVPAFCARLLTIEYIDLAEQSLQALEKLSHEHPRSLLKSGALLAVLSYIDFFQTGVQRVAAATAANICRGLTREYLDEVYNAAPILINLLSYHDAKIVDSACLALTRIAKVQHASPTHMATLCGFGLVDSIVNMVKVSENGSISASLSGSTFYGMINLLAACADGSSVVAEALLNSGMSSTLRSLLEASPLLNSSSSGEGNRSQSIDQIQDLVSLASQLLPPISDADNFMKRPDDGGDQEDVIASYLGSMDQESDCGHVKLLKDHPQVMENIATDLLAIMLRTYSAIASPVVKEKVLKVVIKILVFTPAEFLQALVLNLPISSLITSLLRDEDLKIAAKGMQMATILIAKLPVVFTKAFLREGVVDAMEKRAAWVKNMMTMVSKDEDETKMAQSEFLQRSESGMEMGLQPEDGDSMDSESPQQSKLKEQQTALGLHAQKFLEMYFTNDSGTYGCDTEGISELREICSMLPSKSGVEKLLLKISTDVSTFEIVTSCALTSLREYLEGVDIKENMEQIMDAESACNLLDRLGHFISIALPLGSGSCPPMAGLIRKVQGVLENTEQFKIQGIALNSMPSSFAGICNNMEINSFLTQRSTMNDGLAAGLKALNNPLQIRLIRATGEKQLKEFHQPILFIEPLATMDQIENFLWKHVQPPASTALSSQRPKRGNDNESQPSLGNPSASEGKEKKQGRPIPNAERRVTRAQSRAAAAASARLEDQNDVLQYMHEDGIRKEQVAAEEGNPCSSSVPMPSTATKGKGREHRQRWGYAERSESMTPDIEKYGLDVEFCEGEEEMELEEDEFSYRDSEQYLDEDEEFSGEDDDELFDSAAMRIHDMYLSEDQARFTDLGFRNSKKGRRTEEASERDPRNADPSSGRRQTYAGALAADQGTNRHRLRFFIDGRPLDSSITVFQAVQQSIAQASDHTEAIDSSALWRKVHTLTYACPSTEDEASKVSERACRQDDKLHVPNKASWVFSSSPQESTVAEILRPAASICKSAKELKVDDPCIDALAVLSILESLNRLAPQLLKLCEARRGAVVSANTPLPGHVPGDNFINDRVGSKVSQQLKNYVSVFANVFPRWCSVLIQNAHFLIPFEVRRRYFYCTSFGATRALMFLKQTRSIETGGGSTGRHDSDDIGSSLRSGRLIPRQKVRISRDRVLKSAHHIFKEYASSKSILEVEFFNEAGSGLGPTLEFYTLLSHELQKGSLWLWRHSSGNKEEERTLDQAAMGTGEDLDSSIDDAVRKQASSQRHSSDSGDEMGTIEMREDAVGRSENILDLDEMLNDPGTALEGQKGDAKDQLVSDHQGLFPRPIDPSKSTQETVESMLRHFELLGRVVAKALQDFRLLDLPINPMFYKIVMKRHVGLYDVRFVDQALGSNLEKLYAATCSSGTVDGQVLLDGCPVEDLCLTFVYPGEEYLEICPGGSSMTVNSENLREYINAVVDLTLGSGIYRQIEAFRTGFEAIFPIKSLSAFYEDEIEAMLCGTGEKWTPTMLSSVIKFDHGYTRSSPPIMALLEVLSELDSVDQRRFLRFVTGSPRLPPGGLAALHPRLTVVRKLTKAMHDPNIASEGDMGVSIPGGSLPFSDSASYSLSSPSMASRDTADGDLPSVMTCANYLKLPPYSCKEVLKQRLLFAICEGQGSFDLS